MGDMHAGVEFGVFVIALAGRLGVDVDMVLLLGAGHADIGLGTIACPAENFVAITVDGGALGGLDGDRVAEVNVLCEVVTFKDGAGLVADPAGRDPVGLGVDAVDLPALTVADLFGDFLGDVDSVVHVDGFGCFRG